MTPNSGGLVLEPEEEFSLSSEAVASLAAGLFAKGALFRFRAGGHSMHPWIRNGDVLTLAPLAAGEPAIGDVAVFLVPESKHLLAHRVIARQGDNCVFKGDRLAKIDGIFPVSGLLGRITAVHRNGKRIRFGMGAEKRLLAWISRIGMKRREMIVNSDR